MHHTTAVLLPGTGSDADFVARAFTGPLHSRGFDTVAVQPDPRRVVTGYLDALDAAARRGPIIAAGVSLGAAVALNWAKDHPGDVVAVLAALPPWTGAGTDAPAAISARITATQLRENGLEAVVAAMRGGSPEWLGAELARSWRAQWPDLPSALDEAAAYVAPECRDLGAIETPVGIAVATDDPVHPAAVGDEWARHLPRAGVGRIVLADIAADAAALGAATLTGLDAVP